MYAAICLLLLAAASTYVAGSFVHVFVPGAECNRRFPSNDPNCPVDLSSNPNFCNLLDAEGRPFDPEFEPGPNQRSCFRTCVRSDAGNNPVCRILPRARLRNVSLPTTVADGYFSVRLISPNFFRGNYRKSTICRYNVVCPDDALLYFVIISHNLDSTRDPDSGECVDFLAIDRTSTGTLRTTCGPDIEIENGDQRGFNERRLRVEFRSNRVQQSPGFFMTALCVNRSFFTQDGCMDLPGGRGKRTVTSVPERFNEVFNIREKRSFRVRYFKVLVGFAVRYQDYAITVFNEDDGKVIYWFPGIRLLRVYNPVEGYLDFSRSATRDGELRNFPGFGELLIGKGVVYFIQTEVNPRFLLTEEEQALVNDVLSSFNARRVFMNETYDVEDEIDLFDDPTPTPTGLPGIPGIDVALVSRTLLGQNACNGVVRAFSEIFIRNVRETAPGLLPSIPPIP